MRIFVSPLDWGLGHATRCIPIIRYLIKKNADVLIGAEGPQLVLLKEHFPSLEYIDFPGYRVSYSKNIPAGVKVLVQLPKIISSITKEHEQLNKLINEKKIDGVISDNRYGLWNKKIPSVIITHQLNIQAPAGSTLLSKRIQKHIKHFNECWIPDFGNTNLSGALSHPIPKGINGKYIGPLSRFDFITNYAEKKRYDLLVILSGPESQRSKLERLLLKQLDELPFIKSLIIQGLPGNESTENKLPNVKILPHIPDKEFQEALNCSEVVLSRPGYSTIMDLFAIGHKKTIFIPTPGQTEQEYLGELMKKKALAITCYQNGFSLREALEKATYLKSSSQLNRKENYKAVIDSWLKKII